MTDAELLKAAAEGVVEGCSSSHPLHQATYVGIRLGLRIAAGLADSRDMHTQEKCAAVLQAFADKSDAFEDKSARDLLDRMASR